VWNPTTSGFQGYSRNCQLCLRSETDTPMNRLVGFLTYEQIHASPNSGSSRVRARMLTKHWPESEVFKIGRKYSAVIFQNSHWCEYARRFGGAKILDVSDPNLLWNPEFLAMTDLCDAVSTPTSALADFVAQYTETPTFCVPNGIDLDSLCAIRKTHRGNGPTQKAAWFGNSMNYMFLDSAIPFLAEHGIRDLVVVAEGRVPYSVPYKFGGKIQIRNYIWDLNTARTQLLEADVVVNFRTNFGRYRFMSDDKTILAWSLGLPVAHSPEELKVLIAEDARISEADRRYLQVRRENDVRRVIENYQSIISEIGARGGLIERS
jgi:hypothetical protein